MVHASLKRSESLQVLMEPSSDEVVSDFRDKRAFVLLVVRYSVILLLSYLRNSCGCSCFYCFLLVMHVTVPVRSTYVLN